MTSSDPMPCWCASCPSARLPPAFPSEVFMRLIGLAIALAASLALAPLAVEAQRAGEVSRIGFLSHLSSPPIASRYQAFQKGLRDLGWLEGKNITIEYRFAEGKRERLPELAGELFSHKVEIVVVEGGEAASVVQKMSNTIPVVMAEATAPLKGGLFRAWHGREGTSQACPSAPWNRLESGRS
jgi:ABC-type uncharacterized transport system substrate-binding protein